MPFMSFKKWGGANSKCLTNFVSLFIVYKSYKTKCSSFLGTPSAHALVLKAINMDY